MKRAALASMLFGVAALWTVGPAAFAPGWLAFWVALPTAGILAGRWARRWRGPGDSRAWGWLATSGGALAWLSLILAVPGLLALPSMIRSRVSYNTTRTVAEIRELLAAEKGYRESTGSYASLECLAAPSRCVTGPAAPPVVRADLLSLRPRFGFARYFYPGAARGRGLESFAYLAVPLVATSEAGAFRPPTGDSPLCADSTGRICRVTGTALAPRDGRCPGRGIEAGGPFGLPPCEPEPSAR